VHYCSKVHQKEHWRRHKLECNKQGSTVFDTTAAQAVDKEVRARSLFPEYTLAVEDEVFEGDDAEELQRVMERANIWEDARTEGGADEAADAALTQADYQRAMGSEVHDPTYINFLTRVERGGKDQVLRYCRTEAPTADTQAYSANTGTAQVSAVASSATRSGRGLLLLSSDKELLRNRAAALEASPCPHCGAPRTFEFQVCTQSTSMLALPRDPTVSSVFNALSCYFSVRCGLYDMSNAKLCYVFAIAGDAAAAALPKGG
jgi:hypothetical protein